MIGIRDPIAIAPAIIPSIRKMKINFGNYTKGFIFTKIEGVNSLINNFSHLIERKVSIDSNQFIHILSFELISLI